MRQQNHQSTSHDVPTTRPQLLKLSQNRPQILTILRHLQQRLRQTQILERDTEDTISGDTRHGQVTMVQTQLS